MQRAPRLVGSSREGWHTFQILCASCDRECESLRHALVRGYIYGFQVGQLDKVANRASIQVDIFPRRTDLSFADSRSTEIAFLRPNMNPYPFHAPRFPVPFFDNDIEKKTQLPNVRGIHQGSFLWKKKRLFIFYIVCLHGRGQRTYFFISPANSEASSARSVPRSFGAEVCTMWLEAYLEMSPPSFVSWSLIQK